MANYEATRYDFDGANLTDIQGLNTGLIIPWTTASVPSGFLECNGQTVSRSTYADLFAVVGTTYGAGDGSSTFGLPDFQDNCCVSKSPSKSLASTGGANTVTCSGNLSGSLGNTTLSTPEIASHSHTYNAGRDPVFPQSGANQNPNAYGQTYQKYGITISNTGGGGAHSHPLSANFSGSSKSIVQPYLTLMYVIKT